jgi:hypothetical protein
MARQDGKEGSNLIVGDDPWLRQAPQIAHIYASDLTLSLSAICTLRPLGFVGKGCKMFSLTVHHPQDALTRHV